MNKEFMLLNDNTIEVTNENGVETNRGEFENKNVKGILLAENKIEIAEIFRIGFNKELSENKKVIILSNGMLKFSATLVVLTPLVGFLVGAMSEPSKWLISGIYDSIRVLIDSIIPIATATIYWSVIKPIYKNKIREIEALIKKTKNIKKQSEEELNTEKNKTITNTLEPLVKVSLEDETNSIKIQITEELINHHHEYIKQRGKVKVRKR